MKHTDEDRKVNVPVEVYAELTPNPESMKFVTSQILLEKGSVEYESKQDAVNSPLAAQLFDFSGVSKIFITSNFITVTKEKGTDWFDITNILREFVRGFLMSGEKIFIVSPNAPEPERPVVSGDHEPDPETEQKIRQLLDDYVRPAVEGDGGAIHFQSYHDGIVSVVLKGACSGCPSSTVTLKAGIENLLKNLVPGVKEVVAIEG